jgi:hypothetical protein
VTKAGALLMTSEPTTATDRADGPVWVVASFLDEQLVSVLSVPGPGAAVALATVLGRFWPQLAARSLCGPAAAALIAEHEQNRGDGSGR